MADPRSGALSFEQQCLSVFFTLSVLFLNILIIYLTQVEQQAEGEGEAGFPLSREPNAGLSTRTLGS